MAQFEEQFTAAKVVTSFTRPLNLYYGLAQAGMAIAAARAPNPWSFNEHGLELVDRHADLADMQMRPESEGAFQKVASGTGSPGISASISLGTLWASLPDLAGRATLPHLERSVPLDLLSDEDSAGVQRATIYIPGEMPTEESAWFARFTEIMADYPGARGWLIPRRPGAVRAPEKPRERWQISVEWPAPDPSRELSEEELKAFFDQIAPEYRYRFDRFLRPAIDTDGKPPPSPLMAWWILLYSFSILARYEPRRWVALLDLDKSEAVVSLHYVLEEALTVLPHLVLEALDGEPYLLSKPILF
jgi:hypothetical protein